MPRVLAYQEFSPIETPLEGCLDNRRSGADDSRTQAQQARLLGCPLSSLSPQHALLYSLGGQLASEILGPLRGFPTPLPSKPLGDPNGPLTDPIPPIVSQSFRGALSRNRELRAAGLSGKVAKT